MPDLPRSVLLLTDRYPPHPGGLSRASQRLAHHGSEFAQVHVLVLRDELAPPGVLSSEEGSITVHRLGGLRNVIEAGQAAAQAIDWLHARHWFDLLHGQYGSTGGFLAAYHARRLGAAGYVSLRGNDLDRDLYDPARAAHLIWALQQAHGVGAVSKALVRDAEALSGRAVRYTPNSVDGEVFSPRDRQSSREALGIDAGPVVGFVGELRYKKGAPFILDAYRALPPDLGAQLLLVGVIRAEERKLLELFQTEEPELATRIRIQPYVDDAEALCNAYGAMDLVLSPSLWEGMPNAVLEAMACGRPVLASDAGGIPDLVSAGKTGWLISRHDLHRLGEALAEVLTLPAAEREAVGAAGSAYVREHFPPEREKRELREAYAACLAARA